MLSRGVVSLGSAIVAALSVVIVLMSGWWNITGQIGQTESIFMFSGWLLSAVIFTWRAVYPEYLDPQSIIKRG
jgi:hypothetical protein